MTDNAYTWLGWPLTAGGIIGQLVALTFPISVRAADVVNMGLISDRTTIATIASGTLIAGIALLLGGAIIGRLDDAKSANSTAARDLSDLARAVGAWEAQNARERRQEVSDVQRAVYSPD